MIRIFLFILLTCCFSIIYGQNKAAKFNLSIRYLAAGDITVQSPDGDQSVRNNVTSLSSGFDLNYEIPVKRNFWFSTGYRWKEYWGTVITTSYGEETSLGTNHALYAKLIWHKYFLKTVSPNRFSFDTGGGIMGTMNFDSGAGSSIFTSGPIGGPVTLTGVTNWEAPNHVFNPGAALDAMMNLHVRLYKRLHASAGYGYTYGLRKINQGTYSLTGTSVVYESGKVSVNGSCVYMLAGLRFKF